MNFLGHSNAKRLMHRKSIISERLENAEHFLKLNINFYYLGKIFNFASPSKLEVNFDDLIKISDFDRQ